MISLASSGKGTCKGIIAHEDSNTASFPQDKELLLLFFIFPVALTEACPDSQQFERHRAPESGRDSRSHITSTKYKTIQSFLFYSVSSFPKDKYLLSLHQPRVSSGLKSYITLPVFISAFFNYM